MPKLHPQIATVGGAASHWARVAGVEVWLVLWLGGDVEGGAVWQGGTARCWWSG